MDSCQNLPEIDEQLDEINSIAYLCEGEHSEPEIVFLCRAAIIYVNHLKNWLEKSDFKFNLELSEFLNRT